MATLHEMDRISPELLGGLGLSFAIFVLTGILSDEVSLIGLLAVPPLLAALFTTRLETMIVAGVSVLLALISGTFSDFGSGDHFAGVLVVAAGGVIGLAIAELRERMELANDAAELLAEAGATLIHDQLDAERATRHVVELAVPALADVATIELLDSKGRIEPAIVHAATDELAEQAQRFRGSIEIDPDAHGPLAEQLRRGEGVILPTVSKSMLEVVTADGEERNPPSSLAPRSAMIVPLRRGDRTFGALTLGLYTPARSYREGGPRAAAAEALASRAAVALDSARVHERQTEIADVLQRDLMPPPIPTIPGVSIASRFQAAGDLTKVGGDFYDIVQIARDEWMVIVGDVCGKGPEAAALTGLVRHMLRVLVEFESRPSALLRRLSEQLQSERSDARFCTAAVVRMTRTGQGVQLLASNAGHPAPLLSTAKGEIRPLASPDELLGVFPEETERRNEGWLLGPGDLLLLYTDGLVEGGSNLDPEWIEQQLRAMNGNDPESLASGLLEAAIRRRERRSDDIAVLAIRVD